MSMRPILITGFEPFDGFDRNPSAEIVRRLDGTTVSGVPAAGRILPVSLKSYRGALEDALRETNPGLVIGLGLAQGEATVRVERAGLNLADFEIADNDGVRVAGRVVEEGGPEARFATIPVAAIVKALLDAGIPAHASTSAGAYLCNACFYSLLGMVGPVPGGFIHLPYMPEQVAALIAEDRRKGVGVPSMALDDMARAVGIAIEVSLLVRRSALTI